jgi:Protein of unknown function (DUF1861)
MQALIRPYNPEIRSSHLLKVDPGVHSIINMEFYNPAIALTHDGRLDVFARYETNSKENDSAIVVGRGFFDDDEVFGVRIHEKGRILDQYQDPFHCGQFTDIDTGSKYQVFGAVKIFVGVNGDIEGWDTRLFRYDSPSIIDEVEAGREFVPFFVGPKGMKGIRPIELADGTTGCFVRPQGGFGGGGRIAFLRTKYISQLPDAIDDFVVSEDESKFVHGLTRPDIGQWGGVNRAVLNPNGTLTLSYHVAYFLKEHGVETKIKRYEAWAAIFDPYTCETIEAWQVAASDTHFGEHEIRVKNPDLEGGILYPDSYYKKSDGGLYLITGIGDTTMGATEIDSSNFAKHGALDLDVLAAA